MSATAKYPSSILEEELKNKVAADWFGTFDCSRILGKVDFCAAVPATDLPLCDAESVLLAEAKRGADAPLDFAQFFMRIHDEIPGCVLAEFSKLKHLQSPNFKAFRQAFHGTLEKCFIVPADTFDNVKGDFPIGFCVWRLGNDVQRRDAEAQIGFANARDARSYHVDEPVGSRVPRDRSPLQDSKTPSCESNEGTASLRLCVKDKLSPAARAVLDAGRELWRYYHAQPNANPNASFYDIRLHFQGSTADEKGKVRMNNESSDTKYTALIGDLRKAMKALVRHIKPKVYEYGFLRR